MKKIYRLTPSLHECIWGGDSLKDLGKKTEGGKFGESWELSFVKGSEALVDGVKISDAFDRSAWGSACVGFEDFPVLTKFIDAADKLSVQVHPSDEYALKNEGQYGKTEMWYVVDAKPGAGIYMGLKEKVTPEEFIKATEDGTVEELLCFKEVKPSEVYFIPAGTVHAIGAGTLIFEIQQNSTLTYRLYDYMRKDKAGNPRELHIDKAMKVASLDRYTPPRIEENGTLIGKCKYFETHLYKLSGGEMSLSCADSYMSLTCTRGEGTVEGESVRLGDSFFIPCGAGSVTVTGDLDLAVITTPTSE